MKPNTPVLSTLNSGHLNRSSEELSVTQFRGLFVQQIVNLHRNFYIKPRLECRAPVSRSNAHS